MTILQMANLTKTYEKKEIFSNFNLVVQKGEMVAIVGESGSGKTTLLNILGLITKKDSGDLVIANIKNPAINSKEAMLLRRNKLGYLFQNYGLVDEGTVIWNLNLALEYKKLNKKERIEKISALLQEFNLYHLHNKFVYQLSGGEQQRIAILKLILQDSEIILADEPTASLDINNEQIILEYLVSLNNKGKTIVVVTHNNEILPYFNRIINLR